jgi:hypothetical protein
MIITKKIKDSQILIIDIVINKIMMTSLPILLLYSVSKNTWSENKKNNNIKMRNVKTNESINI